MEPVSPDRVQPLSAFEVTFPSSVLWGLMGCVTTFAISIVLERMQGTLLRLQVAPASWGQILAGKGLACFLACCAVATLLLVVGRLFFGVRIDPARLPLLALAVGSTAAAFTGLMMFVSTLGKTTSGVAGAGWGLMMPLAMLGGGMIPLIAMPNWLFQLSSISPVKWGILSLEGAIWRNFSVGEMLLPCGILLAVGAVGFVAGAQILSLRETGRGWLPGTRGKAG
jgi:ABC-2 type transport system permease protein